MTEQAAKSATLFSKFKHEFREMLLISAFFGLFFFAFASYKMYLLHQFRSAQFVYTTALLNTLVLAKVILLGGFVRLGKRMDHMPLIVSSIYKSAFFAVLVAAFHWVEEFVKDAFHGGDIVDAFQSTLQATSWPLLGLAIICFCLFIPFFALWEVRRVMGEKKFDDLFLRRRTSDLPLVGQA